MAVEIGSACRREGEEHVLQNAAAGHAAHWCTHRHAACAHTHSHMTRKPNVKCHTIPPMPCHAPLQQQNAKGYPTNKVVGEEEAIHKGPGGTAVPGSQRLTAAMHKTRREEGMGRKRQKRATSSASACFCPAVLCRKEPGRHSQRCCCARKSVRACRATRSSGAKAPPALRGAAAPAPCLGFLLLSVFTPKSQRLSCVCPVSVQQVRHVFVMRAMRCHAVVQQCKIPTASHAMPGQGQCRQHAADKMERSPAQETRQHKETASRLRRHRHAKTAAMR